MNKRALLAAFAAVSLAAQLSGCAKILGNLRRDLDDSEPYSQPTTGGRWTERGMLDAGEATERYDYVGHSERGPASVGGDARGARSWISPEEADAGRRDRYRGADSGEDDDTPTMSNTPNLDPPTKRMYKNGSRATKADFVDETPNEGSLWGSDGQTNYYFTKNKVRGIGDIITVTMEADMVKDVSTEVKRTLSPKEKEYELAAAQMRLQNEANGIPADGASKDQVATSAAAPARAPAAADGSATPQPTASPKEVREATPDDVDVGKSLAIKPGDTMMAEILDRYPNGNYKIRGTKRILYKGGRPRLVNLVGIARSQDIGEDDVIASGKLYEYRLEATR